jgi:amino acid transporter
MPISVIAMERLQIPILPSIVTAALLTTIISAGNAYMFNASRSLHALSLEGQAPKFLRRLNKQYGYLYRFRALSKMLIRTRSGVPYMAVLTVTVLTSLSYLALGSSSAQVLNWILK